jgi:hypothetical protein
MAQSAQGAAAQESGESDELSGIPHVNEFEFADAFSDARVLLTDGTESQNGAATTIQTNRARRAIKRGKSSGER